MIVVANAEKQLKLFATEKLSPFLAEYAERIRQTIIRYGRSAPRDSKGFHDRYSLLGSKRELSDDEAVVLLAAIHDQFCAPSARLVRHFDTGESIEATLASGYLPYLGVTSAAREFADLSVERYQVILDLIDRVPVLLMQIDHDQSEHSTNDDEKQIRGQRADMRRSVERYLGSLLNSKFGIRRLTGSTMKPENATRVGDANNPNKAEGNKELTPDCTHGDDFRSVVWHGESYSFTANQAPVVRLLWEHWERGVPEVGDETLLLSVDPESPPARLNVLFRGSPAWGTMIVDGATRGTHRLNNNSGGARESHRLARA